MLPKVRTEDFREHLIYDIGIAAQLIDLNNEEIRHCPESVYISNM